MKNDMIIACPNCKKSLKWDECSQFRPFCSERCQLIDLGEWANEGRSIPGTAAPTDNHESPHSSNDF